MRKRRPRLLLPRGAAAAAASVSGDPEGALLGEAAHLHAEPGETCARCGREFEPEDVVRVLRAGRVHDVCPA
jgi:hypothetical protein